MREYELTVLVHPDLEMNLEAATEKIKALIEDNGGKITKETNEGKKRLAYTIKGQDFAVYYYYELELPAPAPAKISSVLNITDEALRYLLVAKDPRRERMMAKRQERKAQEENKEEE